MPGGVGAGGEKPPATRLELAREPKDYCTLDIFRKSQLFTKITSKQLEHRVYFRPSAGCVLQKVFNRSGNLFFGAK